jgi:uncharacterized membrane protein required for colicin V production
LVLILVLTVLLVPVLQPLISEENAARSGIAYLLAMVAALVVVYSIAYLLKRVDRIPVIKQVNHLGGAVLGGCIGVVLLWILLAVMGAFQDVSWCREISACAKNSEILCAIQRFDPMTYVLKEFDFPTLFS